LGQYLKIGHDIFLPYPSQFIIVLLFHYIQYKQLGSRC